MQIGPERLKFISTVDVNTLTRVQLDFVTEMAEEPIPDRLWRIFTPLSNEHAALADALRKIEAIAKDSNAGPGCCDWCKEIEAIAANALQLTK